MMKLEATEIRRMVYAACTSSKTDNCDGCPYRFTCEEHFPYMTRDNGSEDYLPYEYALNEEENVFYVKEA